MTKQKAGVWLFAATSMISIIAALILVVTGERSGFFFLPAGLFFLVLAIAGARKARSGVNGRSAGEHDTKGTD